MRKKLFQEEENILGFDGVWEKKKIFWKEEEDILGFVKQEKKIKRWKKNLFPKKNKKLECL